MKKFCILLYLILGSFCMNSQVYNNEESIVELKTISKEKIKVFPNPASNVINVLGLKNSYRAKIIVSDSYENTVLQYKWAIRKKSISIPVAQLNPGMYFITILSKEQQIQTKFYKN